MLGKHKYHSNLFNIKCNCVVLFQHKWIDCLCVVKIITGHWKEKHRSFSNLFEKFQIYLSSFRLKIILLAAWTKKWGRKFISFSCSCSGWLLQWRIFLSLVKCSLSYIAIFPYLSIEIHHIKTPTQLLDGKTANAFIWDRVVIKTWRLTRGRY